MTFKIGMKVVCVDDRPRHFVQCDLALNAVYTVRGFCRNIHGQVGILLEEVKSGGVLLSGDERGYWPDRFRPAVSPGISFDETIRAPLDSEQWDNRKRVDEPAWEASS